PVSRPVKRIPLVKGGAPEKAVPAKRALPKKTGIRKLRKPSAPSTPEVPMVRASVSKWSKPLSDVAAMSMSVLKKMRDNDEFDAETWRQIVRYRNNNPEMAEDEVEEPTPRKVAGRGLRKPQRGSEQAARTVEVDEDDPQQMIRSKLARLKGQQGR